MSPEGGKPSLHCRSPLAWPRILGARRVAALFLFLAASSQAQETSGATDSGGGLGFDGNKEEPIEISAENGIEWKRDARTYTARGNALAQQGDTSIAADTLIAYLDDQDEISNWEAIGNVKIQTGQSTSVRRSRGLSRNRPVSW